MFSKYFSKMNYDTGNVQRDNKYDTPNKKGPQGALKSTKSNTFILERT